MAFIPLVVSGAVAAGALAGPAVRKLKSMWYSSVDLWTEDLLAKAAKGKITDRVHERESDLSWLVGKINEGQGVALLVGPPGVGKSALMEEVVLRVLEGRYPTLNKDNTHILSLDLKAMIATGGFLDFMENFVFGSGDESLQILVGDILKQSKKGGEGKEGDKYVLFIDEVQELLDKRPAAFDRLKAELARRGVVIVAATTDTLKVREWQHERGSKRHGASCRHPLSRGYESRNGCQSFTSLCCAVWTRASNCDC